jgi:cytochrome P460
MIPSGRKLIPVLVLVVAAALLVRPGVSQRTADLQYDKEGRMLFPKDYRGWTFLTSGLGMTYGPVATADSAGNPRFDNVFVNPAAYRSFLESGTWPDQTVMILEIRGSDSKASINRGGHFQTGVVTIEAHVKDTARGGWAFYGFPNGATESKMIPHTADCYSCHEQNGAVDTTFVQFYPTLVDIATRKGTFKAK